MSTPQPVPLLDLRRPLAQTPGLRQSLIDAFVQVLDGGQYILGDAVAAFERALASYCQTPHAVGTSSGTDALLLALMALDVGRGDDVLCPTFTFFATAGSIARLGARPVFVDCCSGCYNLLPGDAAARRTANVRAVMPVHLFGQLADLATLMPWAEAHGLAVIEDAAQALGASSPQGRAGSIGTAGCFSFFPSKNLGALGDAGLVTTQDAELADRLRVLRVHGGRPKYVHGAVGGNFRLDALQAALLQVKLAHLDAAHAARAAHAAHYDALFAASGLATTQPCVCGAQASAAPSAEGGVLGLPVRRPGRHIFNQYILRIGAGRRDAVRAGLAAAGIGTEIYYPKPLHLQPCFAHLGYGPGDFPHAEAAAQQTLALPIFPELLPQEVERVARTVVTLCGGALPNC